MRRLYAVPHAVAVSIGLLSCSDGTAEIHAPKASDAVTSPPTPDQETTTSEPAPGTTTTEATSAPPRRPAVTVATVAPPVVEDESAQSGSRDALLACIRSYEQGADGYATDTGNGYAGAYQFDRQTWQSVGGSGNPADASPAEQDARAWALYEQRGLSPWPTPNRRCQ